MPYRPYEFAKLIGKSTETLRRWDREGKLKPNRTLGNQQYYTENDLVKALNLQFLPEKRQSVVYNRLNLV